MLGLSQPAAVRVVDRLVARALLRREAGPDGRTRAVSCSPAGERVADAMLGGRAASLRPLLAVLEPREREQLEHLLGRLTACLAADRPGALTACRLCERDACQDGARRCPPRGSRRRARRGVGDSVADDHVRGVLRRGALPLLTGGVVIGLGSAAYWTFAVEHLQRDGGLGVTASRAFLGLVGLSSLLSTATGDLVRRFGGRRVFTAAVAAEAASLFLVAVAPSSLAAALSSAVLFGASYNAIVAIEALWSASLYADRPSLGLAAAMAANAAGLLCGPLASGAFADATGLTEVLLGGAVIIAAAALLAPRKMIVAGERPGPSGTAPAPARSPAAPRREYPNP